MSTEVVQFLGAMASVATTLGVVFGIIGLVFVWLQIRHAILSREASVCLDLAQFSNCAEFTAALERVWNLSDGIPEANADRDAAIKLCVFFELVGAICNHGYMSTKLVEEFYGYLVIDAYSRLQAFVTDYRARTGRPSFASNFESLAKKLSVHPIIMGEGTGK